MVISPDEPPVSKLCIKILTQFFLIGEESKRDEQGGGTEYLKIQCSTMAPVGELDQGFLKCSIPGGKHSTVK